MPDPTAAEHHQSEKLLTDIASRLVAASATTGIANLEAIADLLLDSLDADTIFVRRHDAATRRTALITHRRAAGESEWEQTIGSEADISFDEDPLLAVTERQTAPLITHSRGGSESTPETAPKMTLATIPVVANGVTIGVIGFTRHGFAKWTDGQIETVVATAALLSQLWQRLDGERRSAFQSEFDDLTGLPNSSGIASRVDRLDGSSEASLMIIDVDNMKVINDGLDFATGNQFISGLAKRLASIVRPTGMIARLSGDRFGVLVLETSPHHVERMADRLVKELGQTIRVNEVSISRSVSIGVAHSQIAGTNQELLPQAEAALHQAKRRGKKQVAIFDDEMRSRDLRRFETEIELRQAIESGELTLHYQPEVNLITGEICAVEALLRWNHPRRGLLTAGAFIETAEESGLVVEIGDTVIRQAIYQLSQWHEEHPDLEMWINVSPAQLMSRDLATQISKLVEEFDVPADRICLEVTEHVVLGDLDATTGVLGRLQQMGVKLALDDFGTGYSSMKQLKQLPIDILKIDQTFVAGLGVSDHDSAIVDAAITLASAFDLDTVAEGVETQQQITELRKRGCEHAQGFLLARPAPPEEIAELLQQRLAVDRLG